MFKWFKKSKKTFDSDSEIAVKECDNSKNRNGDIINQRINGIFDEWDVYDDYANISKQYVKGKIKGEVRIKDENIRSTALYTNEVKKHFGFEITIENEKGEDIVFIPQKEIPPLSELTIMENSEIQYESKTWSSCMEGTSVTIKLKFLSGDLKDKIYEGKKFA